MKWWRGRKEGRGGNEREGGREGNERETKGGKEI